MSLVLASVLFAAMGLVIKLMGNAVPMGIVVLARSVVPALFLTPTMVEVWRERRDVLRRNGWTLLFRSLLGGISMVGYFESIRRIDYGDASLLTYSSPVFATIFAALFLKEPWLRRLVWALPLALLGVVCIVKPAVLFGHHSEPRDSLGYLLGIVSGVCAGAAYTAVRHAARECGTNLVVAVFSWVTLLGSLPFVWDGSAELSGWNWVGLAVVGITGLGGQLAMTAGYRDHPTSQAATMLLLVVPLAALSSALVLREIPDPWSLAGMALSLAGIAAVATEHPVPVRDPHS